MHEEPGFNKYGDSPDFQAETMAAERFDLLEKTSGDSLTRSRANITISSVIILFLGVLLGVFASVSNYISTQDIETQNRITNIRYLSQKLTTHVYRAYINVRNAAAEGTNEPGLIGFYVNNAYMEDAISKRTFASLIEASKDYPEISTMLVDLKIMLDELDGMRKVSIEYAKNGQLNEASRYILTVERPHIVKITDYIDIMIDTTDKLVGDSYSNIHSRTTALDAYSIMMTVLIAVICLFIIFYSRHHFTKAVELVARSQRDQREILDELVIMDEQLRQSLSNLEKESDEVSALQERYEHALDASNDAIWEIDTSTGDFFASEKWHEVTGFPKSEKYDPQYLKEHIHQGDHHKLDDILNGVSRTFHSQIRVVDEDSSIRWVDIRGRWLDDHRVMGSTSNITNRKQSEEYIKYVAYHDVITHLPNRAYFIRRLEDALLDAKETGRPGCVFFIDLDNFKFINDGYGHDFGDKLLRAVAEKLSKTFESGPIIARFGGDEFLMLLSDINGDIVNEYLQRVMDVFSDEIMVEGAPYFITASVGVSIFPEDGNDVNQLLKNSDAAMYESKYAGRNTFAFYDKTMSDKVMRKSAITDILRSAVNNGSLYVVFQPQIDPETNKTEGFEVLMRLHDKTLGVVTPAEFIPVAEESRLIVPLGYWAVRKAIEADIDLRRQGLKHKNISVNVSEVQLREQDFVSNIRKILSEYDFDASRLHFEITESSLLNNLDEKTKMFDDLREMGIKIELDDFGTGYSSLNYVRMIHLDVIKIDKCFIDEIGISHEKEELIDLIVRLAKTFGANVIAEGVETHKQIEFVRAKGDIIVQGFYYSKPLELTDIRQKVDDIERIHTPH